MNRLIHYIVLILVGTCAAGLAPAAMAEGRFVPKSMEQKPMDVSANVYSRLDLNERKCALVKLILLMPDIAVEGNVIGDCEFKKGEYWVYLTHGTKQMRIKHGNYLPAMIVFKDLGIPAVESACTYELIVSVENDDPREAARLREYADRITHLQDSLARVTETDEHKYQRALETHDLSLMLSLAEQGYENAYLQTAEMYSDKGELDNAETWARKAMHVTRHSIMAKFLLRHINEERERIAKEQNSDTGRKQEILKDLFP